MSSKKSALSKKGTMQCAYHADLPQLERLCILLDGTGLELIGTSIFPQMDQSMWNQRRIIESYVKRTE